MRINAVVELLKRLAKELLVLAHRTREASWPKSAKHPDHMYTRAFRVVRERWPPVK